ncbi:MAG TPA: NAD(P)H-quinone dehydrogenase [Propionibacteriaceae bacterium]|nr:NAD(P)H-quinone dehydrogenase [Propionibacteriaceae bacterium]
MTGVVIVGGGPGGYEAALVASQLGGEVTLVDRDGLGGAAVLTDCVPSKTLIATAEVMSSMQSASELGLTIGGGEVQQAVTVNLGLVNRRVLGLARAQSADIATTLAASGVRVVSGSGRLDGQNAVIATVDGSEERYEAEVILLATGTRPRELPAAKPDGERILTWKQVYGLESLPEHLVVVGSGVTGAEFASAYNALGAKVTLVSSRDMVLPGQDEDASRVLQDVFVQRGVDLRPRSRAVAVRREGDGVVVTLASGDTIEASHCLMAVGAVPNTEDLGLEAAGITTNGGYIPVDKVSRTNARGVYAAGDVTGVFALASVAAMQGRIAMWHALGDAVAPLDLSHVSSNVFTSPEIATVGVTQEQVDAGLSTAVGVTVTLRGNARAKMQNITEGFVKLVCLPITGIIVGGVVVAPHASELIHAISVAVAERITVESFSHDFTVYPSVSGSIAEAARRLHGHAEEHSITV